MKVTSIVLVLVLLAALIAWLAADHLVAPTRDECEHAVGHLYDLEGQARAGGVHEVAGKLAGVGLDVLSRVSGDRETWVQGCMVGMSRADVRCIEAADLFAQADACAR